MSSLLLFSLLMFSTCIVSCSSCSIVSYCFGLRFTYSLFSPNTRYIVVKILVLLQHVCAVPTSLVFIGPNFNCNSTNSIMSQRVVINSSKSLELVLHISSISSYCCLVRMTMIDELLIEKHKYSLKIIQISYRNLNSFSPQNCSLHLLLLQ